MAIEKVVVTVDGVETEFVDASTVPAPVEATEVHVTEGEEIKIVEDDEEAPTA